MSHQGFPDYKKLSQTPFTKRERQLSEQIRLGSGRKNVRITSHRPAIPHLQRDRLQFPSKPTLSTSAVSRNEPALSVPETPSQYPFANARHVTSKSVTPRQFVNRDDHPLSSRQRQRLQTSLLGGQCTKQSQNNIHRLLELSTEVGKQVLATLQGQQKTATVQNTSPSLSGNTQSKVVEEIVTEAEEKQFVPEESEGKTPESPDAISSATKHRRQARRDIKSLDEEYPTLDKEHQRKLLRKLRERYDAPKNATVHSLKNAIRTSTVPELQR